MACFYPNCGPATSAAADVARSCGNNGVRKACHPAPRSGFRAMRRWKTRPTAIAAAVLLALGVLAVFRFIARDTSVADKGVNSFLSRWRIPLLESWSWFKRAGPHDADNPANTIHYYLEDSRWGHGRISYSPRWGMVRWATFDGTFPDCPVSKLPSREPTAQEIASAYLSPGDPALRLVDATANGRVWAEYHDSPRDLRIFVAFDLQSGQPRQFKLYPASLDRSPRSTPK